MVTNYSKSSLLKFLDTLSEKGLANQNTATGMRVAVAKILSDLSPEEESDVRKVDVGTAVHRVHNKNPGQMAPSSLAEYQRRVGQAIRYFVDFTENPTTFKPIGRGASKPNGHDKREPKSEKTKKHEPVTSQRETPPSVELAAPSATGLALNYPLRSDFLAQVVVPRDMKRDEARRLSAFIMTLASDFVPEG